MEAPNPPSVASPRSGSLLLSLALLALGAAGGWSLHRILHPAVPAEAEEDTVSARVAVTTAAAERGDLTLALAFFGNVIADPTAMRTLSSRGGGVVLSVSAVPGQAVKAGDVLARFDPAPLETLLLAARSSLATAQNQLAEFERSGRETKTRELEALVQKTAADRKQAETEVQRLQPLQADGLVSEKAVTDAVFVATKAKLDHEAAIRAAQAWQAQGAALLAETLTAAAKAAEASLQQAEAAYREAELRAPVAGKIATLSLRVGDKVEPGAALGSLLCDDRRLLDFTVAAGEVGSVHVGNALVFRDPAGKERQGAIERMSAQVGVDGLVEVFGSVVDAAGLLPGCYVHGEFATETLSGVIVVPAAAVQRLDGEDHVVVRGADSKSKRTPVEVLGRRGDRVAVKGALDAGAQVVVEGGYALPDGTQLDERGAKSAEPGAEKDAKASKDDEGHK